ncbi:leucyl/phenylalanyl-tRNA--protein transferase [Roseinatronobacter alkalisoli]|uniref:Leucyl/phenylalanyl-tRNA--protein transferase n=1 Tax=Roseinatronobacter alkalisoli TaxID=3028235 RepID=A0ABT5T8H2_9RHOB|nr:leucyl/phenylalanyl-tRNA--protein transferase [Roseinatronobacter sp. HJB301]MDD7971422.1 leucyl/phenylalanyl-tRNA--protein transferase [Roseinatronobacter sp. HJB301]
MTAQHLLQAYRQGVFPMAESRDDDRLYWFDPVLRGVLPLDGFHLSRSLARRIRTMPFQVTLDHDFAGVMAGCAARDVTWINSEIMRLFNELHALSHAHSLEIWDGRELVGGVYGVAIGGVFCGESMFSRRKDASKIALAYLVTHLRACGFTLFDTQYLTDHLASLGGREIPRAAYRRTLAAALQADADIRRLPLPAVHDVLHLRTHKS